MVTLSFCPKEVPAEGLGLSVVILPLERRAGNSATHRQAAGLCSKPPIYLVTIKHVRPTSGMARYQRWIILL
jgi:hypothetical protein